MQKFHNFAGFFSCGEFVKKQDRKILEGLSK